ncbi:MAG TPA: hypothetical protein DDX19_03135 [Rhodopirellula baltica]|nr:hypothetical protein [Rhodopirellula baltica]
MGRRSFSGQSSANPIFSTTSKDSRKNRRFDHPILSTRPGFNGSNEWMVRSIQCIATPDQTIGRKVCFVTVQTNNSPRN